MLPSKSFWTIDKTVKFPKFNSEISSLTLKLKVENITIWQKIVAKFLYEYA